MPKLFPRQYLGGSFMYRDPIFDAFRVYLSALDAASFLLPPSKVLVQLPMLLAG